MNLIINAAKYTRSGGAIHVAVAAEGPTAVVRIRDNGTAFVPEAVSTGARPGKGLSNVRNRTQALGGQCEWTTWAGGGEFSLALRILKA